MAKILFSADWHIMLGKKGVPKKFQTDRFMLLVEELNKAFVKQKCDLHIIGGDILDKFAPTVEESELYYELIAKINHKTIIYTGNHEMISKTKTVLDTISKETSRCNPLVTVVGSLRTQDFDIVDYRELHKSSWDNPVSKLCFTHVRGSIPPHVEPEVDLDKFKDYELIITGDLHSHKNTQNIPSGASLVYPGSPLTTSFHRKKQAGANGFLTVDTGLLSTQWHELGYLPQLIRKTVNAGEPMPTGEYDRVIYEVIGDLSDLKNVEDSDVLDKKIHKNLGSEATLS